MSNWKDKFSFLNPPSVEHKVGGQTLNFYPMSVKVTFRLQTLASPILEALTVLFSRPEGDAAQEANYAKDGTLQHIHNQAVPTETAKMRTEQRQGAMKKAMTALLAPNNADILGYLICDSLRDDMPRDMKQEEKTQFAQDIDISVLTAMLIGVFKANKEVFAPLLEDLVGPMERGLTAMGLAVPPPVDEASSETAPT